MTILKQEYYVVHRTNDPEILIHGKEGPRLYLTKRNAEKQALHWSGWDVKHAEWPNPPQHMIEATEKARRDGPWIASKIMITLRNE